MKAVQRPLRVILLPELVPSASTCLGRALKLMGHQVKVLSRYTHRFGFTADEYITKSESSETVKFLKHLFAGRYLFSNYDIVHFNYGSTLFDSGFGAEDSKNFSKRAKSGVLRFLQILEIAILRLRRIPIFVHFQGDDAVQGDLSLQIFDDSIAMHVETDYYTGPSDNLKRKRIKWFDEFADAIFCVTPDMKWFLPERAKFIPYACTNILDLVPSFQEVSTNSLKVCHAPSDRDVKGTSFILNAVEKLRRDGYAIELQILENLSHDKVLERISDCDVFIDQLHHGWYGGVAVEAMALGKPVICYIREKDLIYVSELMVSDLPIIHSNPDFIYETLRTLLSQSHSSLVQIGRDSRRFVEAWHDPMKIAGEILSIYRDSIEGKKLRSTHRFS